MLYNPMKYILLSPPFHHRHGEAKSKVTHGLVSLWWVHKYKDTSLELQGQKGK